MRRGVVRTGSAGRVEIIQVDRDDLGAPAAVDAAEDKIDKADRPVTGGMATKKRWWNLPNALTLSRLVLGFVFFALLGWSGKLMATEGALPESFFYDAPSLLRTGFVIFLIAAITDTLDGQIARAWQLETDFGRIADPFADKVIICGAFVFLSGFPESYIRPWMVVVVLAREFLVNGIRGFAESRGVKFGADKSGKAKMFAQCVAVGVAVFYLGAWPATNSEAPAWADILFRVSTYLAVGLTIFSGMLYIGRARRVLAEGA